MSSEIQTNHETIGEELNATVAERRGGELEVSEVAGEHLGGHRHEVANHVDENHGSSQVKQKLHFHQRSSIVTLGHTQLADLLRQHCFQLLRQQYRRRLLPVLQKRLMNIGFFTATRFPHLLFSSVGPCVMWGEEAQDRAVRWWEKWIPKNTSRRPYLYNVRWQMWRIISYVCALPFPR